MTTSGRTDQPPTETPTESSSDLASIGGPTTWSPQAKLAASTGTDGDEFGTTVSISADRSTAVVGAPGADSRFSPAAGSAYVFDRAGGKWSQSATLLASDGPEGTAFGRDVAVDDHGDRILVGAPGEDSGTAYLFEAGPDGWTQTARLPVGTDGSPVAGDTVALSGDGSTALVGTGRTETAARVFAVDGADSPGLGPSWERPTPVRRPSRWPATGRPP
ncbi:FG-GAP repeat protein [Halapricum sp. CBA1109]|uniref:FG-GAP repeat protein n=1 Tax=Halapricum sp. CBA1109 TaxID=2668068 RepID=UPI0018D26322